MASEEQQGAGRPRGGVSGGASAPQWLALRRRPRVLLAWEHGRNFGRLSRLLAVARMVEEQGGEPVWVVPRSQRNAPALAATSHRRMEAPVVEQQTFPPDFRADSFADVMLALGFAQPDVLLKAVHAWARIFEQLAPECVVLDYAPAAQMATQLLGLRAYQLTNGFDAPPPDCPPYARVRPESELGQRNAARVATLSANIARAGEAFAGRDCSSLAAILRHPSHVFECIPEADPYGPRRDGLWVGPLGLHGDAVDASWPPGWQRRRVFAHLRSMAGATAMLDELCQSDAMTLCYWRDAPDGVLARYENTSVRLVGQPVLLDRVLAEADAVVNQGSTALVCHTLLAGKPQLIMPTDFEKLQVSLQAAQSGAATLWNPMECNASEALRRLYQSTRAQVAREIAAQYEPAWFQANRNRFARDLIGCVALDTRF